VRQRGSLRRIINKREKEREETEEERNKKDGNRKM
jgi:hypothetical protein